MSLEINNKDTEKELEKLEKYILQEGDKIKIIGIVGKVDNKYRLIVSRVDENINPIGKPGYVDFENEEISNLMSEAKRTFDNISQINRSYV